MKDFVVLVCFLIALFFCGCSADTSGYKYELTSNEWNAQLEGGGSAELEFDNGTASLTLSNGELSRTIKGRYIADNSSFVIFVPELKFNYSFEYTPKGNTLDLVYNSNTLTLKRSEK